MFVAERNQDEALSVKVKCNIYHREIQNIMKYSNKRIQGTFITDGMFRVSKLFFIIIIHHK